ncbi:MurR/RpiR family transcriptional regulator [Thaumasiovibrio subtropicus]|uniref:MurR/RpiR family transcriptional regulator n=1 Tax=Thaumasiovibrio subtropicus TaxID=1891207 RepID=UPI000B351A3A|nr:MurR/RpiR family transcriptional regulator [Thaumasiovibrio subtropicus]
MDQTLNLAELKLKIASRSPLPNSEQRVADFIIDNFEQIPYLGIEELAKRSSASKTSVGRFVQNIGFQGYSRFKQAIVLHIRETQLVTPTRIASRLAQSDVEEITAKGYLSELAASFQTTAELIDEDKFNLALSLMENRDNALYVFGPASSNGLVTYFTMLSRYVRKSVHHLTPDVSLLPHHLLDMRQDDVLFVISYYRYSDLAVKLVEWFHKRGGKVIVLTNNSVNPYLPYSDVQLLVESGSSGVFQSRIAGFAMVEALVNALTQRMGTPDRFESLEQILTDFDTFHQ